MALTPQSNEAFLREVDEGLRRDQAVAVWQRFGRWIIVLVIVVLAAVGGWLWWLSQQEAKAGEQSIAFNESLDALGANRVAEATPKLDTLVKEGTPGYAALSRFVQADIALQQDDLKAAAAKFGEVAGDPKAEQPLRDLALIRQVSAEYDTLTPQAVIDRLRPLAVKGQPWFGSAGEMTAIAHLRMGRRDLAGRLFGEIAQDEGVPPSIRQRAVQMAGVLGVDAVDQSKDTTSG